MSLTGLCIWKGDFNAFSCSSNHHFLFHMFMSDWVIILDLVMGGGHASVSLLHFMEVSCSVLEPILILLVIVLYPCFLSTLAKLGGWLMHAYGELHRKFILVEATLCIILKNISRIVVLKNLKHWILYIHWMFSFSSVVSECWCTTHFGIGYLSHFFKNWSRVRYHQE